MILLLLACGPKKTGAAPDDYFPLIEGTKYHYVATFNGMDFAETRVAMNVGLGDGSEGWAFVEEDEIGDSVAGAFTGNFGLGLYRNTGSAVETIEAFWLSEADQRDKSQWQTMLDLPLTPGASVKMDTDSPDRSGAITVVGFETVTVPAGTYSNCAHLDLGQEGSEAWLCPGVGLVKWVLVTGRVEQLAAVDWPS